MPVSTLNKFTVPLSTNDSKDTQGLLMPKLKYRFRVTFVGMGAPGTETTELTKQVVDFTRPQVTFDEMVIDIYNSKIKLAGKHSWGDATINLRDDAVGNVSRIVGEQLQKQFDFFEQSSASSGIDYKFKTVCEILDGGNGANTPRILETWELVGCYLSDVNYNDLNYGTSEPVTLSLVLKFDNAIQTDPTGNRGPGVGLPFARTLGDTSVGS